MKMGPFLLKKETTTSLFCIALFLALYVGDVRGQEEFGFSVKAVEGPQFVEQKQSFTLTCKYDMGDCSLFKLTWKFNDAQFFLYDPTEGGSVPSDAPVLADVDASNATTVVVRSARLRDAGEYKCEVTTQGIEYFTVSTSANLTVGVLPKKRPTIEPPVEKQPGGKGAELEKRAGDRVFFVCVSAPSFPASALSWTSNGEEVTEGLVLHAGRRAQDGTYAARLDLNLTLTAQHFQRGRVQLRCKSELHDVSLESAPRVLVDPGYEEDDEEEEEDTSSLASGLADKARWGVTAFQLALQVAVLVVADQLF